MIKIIIAIVSINDPFIKGDLLISNPQIMIKLNEKQKTILQQNLNRLGAETMKDIVILCKICHSRYHRGLIEPKQLLWIINNC